jgi:hypothetical protein
LVPRDRISVLSKSQVPADLQVDGQLSEWGIFAAGTPSPLTPSFVVVAASSEALVLAGRIRDLPERGLWLRLETDAPEFPPIGSLQRGGGIATLDCDAVDDPAALPFDRESCLGMLETYDAQAKGYAALFVRQLHLTAQALSARDGDQEQPVTEAKYRASAEAGTLSFEAVLPLRALPMITSAELSWLIVDPLRADAGPPNADRPEVVQSVSFANPIRFGLDSQLLECVLQGAAGALPTAPRFSYQPGVPNRIFRAANVAGFSVAEAQVTLSSHEASLGPIEVRSVEATSPLVAVLNAGQLVECESVGQVLGVVARGRGLHVIGYSQEQDEAVNLEGAELKVLEIEKDGTLHDDLLEMPARGFGYMSVAEQHSKDLATLSISGTYQADDGGSQQHTLSWRYDAKSNHYALRERNGRHVPPSFGE